MSSGACFSWSLPILRWKTSYCSIWVKWKKNVDCTNQTQLYSKPTSGGPPSQLLVVASRTPRSLLVTKVCHQSTFEKKKKNSDLSHIIGREWMKALYHFYLYIDFRNFVLGFPTSDSELFCCLGWSKSEVSLASIKHERSILLAKFLLMEEILHQLIGRFCQYLQGFIHPRWLGMGFQPSTVSLWSWVLRSLWRYWNTTPRSSACQAGEFLAWDVKTWSWQQSAGWSMMLRPNSLHHNTQYYSQSHYMELVFGPHVLPKYWNPLRN